MKSLQEMTDKELDDYIASLDRQESAPQQSPTTKDSGEAADISWVDRFAVKNFGGDLSNQISYLQNKNPDMEFNSDSDGEIIARKKGGDWKRIDPKGVTSVKEFFQDAGDVAWDVADIAASKGAALAAGLTGGVFGGGIGAVPSAVLTDAAVSAGMEGGRQLIGNMLGTAQGVDKTNLALATAAGSLPTAVLGAGFTKKQVSKALENPEFAKSVLKKESLPTFFKEDEAGQQILQNGKNVLTDESKALAGDALLNKNGVVPWLLNKGVELTTKGVKAKEIKDATDIVGRETIDMLNKNGIGLDTAQKYTYQQVVDVLENQGAAANFGQAVAATMPQTLKQAGDYFSGVIENAFAKDASLMDISGAGKALREATKQSEKFITTGAKGKGEAAQNLLKEFFTSQQDLKKMGVLAEDPKALQAFTQALEGKPLAVTVKEAQAIKAGLDDYAFWLQNSTSIDRKDAVTKSIIPAVRNAAMEIGDQIWERVASSGKEGQNLRSLYQQYKKDMAYMDKHFGTPEKSLQNISNINNKSNKIMKERLRDFDTRYNKLLSPNDPSAGPANMLDLAKLGTTLKIFGDPSLQQIGRGATTSTTNTLTAGALGGAIGYIGLKDIGHGYQHLGTILGAAAGATLTSPAAVSGYTKGFGALRRGAEYALEKTPQAVKNVASKAYEMQQSNPWTRIPFVTEAAWKLGDNK